MKSNSRMIKGCLGTMLLMGSQLLLGQDDQTQPAPYRNVDRALSTAAVSTVGSSTLVKTVSTAFENSMVGTLSGLSIMRNGGNEPGWESFNFYIRGTGTFGASSKPIVMVDDVERDIELLRLLRPEEVETISILKDAAATAIYGNRAANGVILIKTKRGIEGKTVVHFNANVGIQTPVRLPQYLSSSEYVRLRNVAMAHDGLPIPSNGKYDPQNYDGMKDPYTYADTDWYGAFLAKTSPLQNYEISLRGGGRNVRYYVYFGMMMQDGLYQYTKENKGFNTNSQFSSYNLRSNVDIPITSRLDLSIDLSSRMEIKHSSGSSATDIFSALSSLPPTMPIFNRDHSLGGLSDHQNNPYGMISKTGIRQRYGRDVTASAKANYRFDNWVKGLSINGMISFDSYKEYGRNKSQNYATFEENPDGSYTQYGKASDINLNYARYADDYYLRTSFNGGIAYNNRFGQQGVSVDAKAIYSIMKVTANNANYKKENYYLKAMYDYDRRYVADVTLAYCGSEDFIGANRYGFYPVGSVAWVVGNEPFLAGNKVLTFSKVRASYGMVGNADLGVVRFPYLISYGNTGGYIFGDGFATSEGSYESRITNPNIGAEKEYSANLGVDLELWKQLSITFDYFNKNRVGVITTRADILPAAIGQILPYENIGSVSSQGLETEIRFNRSVGDWSFFARLNLSYVNNTITEMSELPGQASWLYRSGTNVNQQWGLEAVGLFESQDEIDHYAVSTFGRVKPGDVKYRDQNDDNLIDANDRVALGNPSLPTWSGGLQLGTSYKGFDAYLTLSGVCGRSIFVNNSAIYGMYNGQNVTDNVQNAWQAGINEHAATLPRLSTLYSRHNMQQSSLWIYDGSYLKLQNVEIGYSLPQKLLNKAHISETRIFFNGSNLFTLDALNRFGISAESPSAGVTTYPLTATYTLGVSLKF